MTDYSKRSFENVVATFQKFVTAKSVPEVVEIQTTYAKQSYENHMQQMAKIGAMYQSFAKDAFKPVERTFKGSR
jgi:hypothetical protein